MRASVDNCLAFVATSLLCLTLLAVAPQSALGAYPDRPIRIIVPFAPGGGVDIMARLIGDFMSKDFGKPVIVENKPGAGTIVGTMAAASSAPDGYTLLMASPPFAINPSINAKLPYDTFKAFTPVALVARSFDIVVVDPKLPFMSIQDVIAYAKANPGKLNFGSPGIGSSPHLAGEFFKSLAHVDITHVPYKGSAPAITDLLGGQIQMIFSTVPCRSVICSRWTVARSGGHLGTAVGGLPRPADSCRGWRHRLRRRKLVRSLCAGGNDSGRSEPVERVGSESDWGGYL